MQANAMTILRFSELGFNAGGSIFIPLVSSLWFHLSGFILLARIEATVGQGSNCQLVRVFVIAFSCPQIRGRIMRLLFGYDRFGLHVFS